MPSPVITYIFKSARVLRIRCGCGWYYNQRDPGLAPVLYGIELREENADILDILDLDVASGATVAYSMTVTRDPAVPLTEDVLRHSRPLNSTLVCTEPRSILCSFDTAPRYGARAARAAFPCATPLTATARGVKFLLSPDANGTAWAMKTE